MENLSYCGGCQTRFPRDEVGRMLIPGVHNRVCRSCATQDMGGTVVRVQLLEGKGWALA